MNITTIQTLGQLKAEGYKSLSIKEELRKNLVAKLQNNESVFEGIWGYENSVIPELERAILSRHNINLLGLRGQAKTRLARQMIYLLDEWIPVVAGSEINDDPLQPLSRFAKDLIATKGDETPISWLHRSDRFSEKLATPDVTVADLIGDVDPIKAANLRLSYADERVLHFGMIPRANRCIFVINELPDLQARIQVALFNILQEGDIQIRGFKLRLPLDVQFVFTANPEDYTNRGSIVTPLKDRIGSQILTHYPKTVETAKKITQQEANINTAQKEMVYIPAIAYDILEQVGFEARESEYIDVKSGISARMSITALENLISTAERRTLKSQEAETTLRMGDFMGVVPAITGKVELVYEGEQEGAAAVAEDLIGNAIKTIFNKFFPKISKIQRPNQGTPYDALLDWFLNQSDFQLLDDLSEVDYQVALEKIEPLESLVYKYLPDTSVADKYFWMELVLWALVEYEKLSKDRFTEGYQFKDVLGDFLKGI